MLIVTLDHFQELNMDYIKFNVSIKHKVAPKSPIYIKLETDLFENFFISSPTETLNLEM